MAILALRASGLRLRVALSFWIGFWASETVQGMRFHLALSIDSPRQRRGRHSLQKWISSGASGLRLRVCQPMKERDNERDRERERAKEQKSKRERVRV